jgi:hypothetical protein
MPLEFKNDEQNILKILFKEKKGKSSLTSLKKILNLMKPIEALEAYRNITPKGIIFWSFKIICYFSVNFIYNILLTRRAKP